MSRPRTATRPIRALLCLAGAALGAAAHADPADYVFVPYATPGARVLAYSAGAERGRDGARETQHVLTLGWAPTARWFSAVYAAWTAQDGGPAAFDEWSWLNHLQLTDAGAAPVDLGLLCLVERPHDRSEGTGLTCGPTLQADTDRLQFNLDPLLSRRFGAEQAGRATLGYQWQLKGLLRPGLELGAQGFGNVGPWDGWLPASRQAHTIGPALFAKWPVAGSHALQLDAGVQFGLGAGSPRDVLRVRVQDEF